MADDEWLTWRPSDCHVLAAADCCCGHTSTAAAAVDNTLLIELAIFFHSRAHV
jgi:hypothetical protein